MAGVDVHLLADAPVRLTDPPLAARLERVEVRWGEDAPESVVAALVVAPIVWARIDAGALLHLDPGARGPELGAGLADADRVRVEAVLDAAVMRSLGPVDAEQLAQRLREPAPDDPLTTSGSWWALSAVHAVEAPADGELAVGLRTVWTDDPPPEGMISVLAHALAAEGFEADVDHDEPDGPIVRFRADGRIGFAQPRDEVGQALVYIAVPRPAPSDRRDELTRLATLVNYDLPIGCLEFETTAGLVRVRTGVDVAGDRLSIALARNLVGAAAHLADRWLRAAEAVMDGEPAEDALRRSASGRL